MIKKFLRRQGNLISKLGKGRKKKQKWRRPTGRHNKMREKIKGHPAIVGIGYRKDKKLRGKVEDKKIAMIRNIEDIKKLKSNHIAILGNVGKKKRIEIAKYSEEKKVKIHNLNSKRFLKTVKRENKQEDKK